MADLDPIDRARAAITDRAELPGMTLMEHLTELRKRLIHSVIYLFIGFVVAYAFHERLYGLVQAPLDQLHIPLNFTHPTDGLNLYLKTAFVGGAILAGPFILYQIWLFISPGMYANEKKLRLALHVRHRPPLSRRSMVRLSLGPPRRARCAHQRLRQTLPPHPHHRGLHRLLPRRHPRPRHLL